MSATMRERQLRQAPWSKSAMDATHQVADWEEVRDQELSEIITRRLAAGLVDEKALLALVTRWANQGLLPPEAPGEMALRQLDAGLLPTGVGESEMSGLPTTVSSPDGL